MKKAPSKYTIERLILYNRTLKSLRRQGQEWVTSEKIARLLSRNPAQVRKDISILGCKGKTGVGYNINKLIDEIENELGLKHEWRILLMGAGNLGRALFYYPGFKRQGFKFQMVMDSDKRKIGRKWSGIKITSPDNLKQKIKKEGINIAILAVPENAAQEVAEKLVGAGITEILNFAPVSLNLPDYVNISYADLTLKLENLSYHLSRKKKISG